MDSLITADRDPWNLDTKGAGVALTQGIDGNITTNKNISNDVDADDNSTNDATICFLFFPNDTGIINNNTSNGVAVDSTGNNNNINNSTSDDVEINSIGMAPAVDPVDVFTIKLQIPWLCCPIGILIKQRK